VQGRGTGHILTKYFGRRKKKKKRKISDFSLPTDKKKLEGKKAPGGGKKVI
jgi:hypothetical protein